MKFLITCDNCDGQFLTTAESGQTVYCQCPHCGGQMHVKLPKEAETPQTATQPQPAGTPEQTAKSDRPHRSPQPTDSDEPRRRTGCGIVVGIVLGLFLLVLIAMVVYSMTHTDNTRAIEDPFQHVYEDTTALDDTYETLVEDAPDTIEQHIEEPREVEPADTAVSEDPAYSPEATDPTAIPDHPKETEKTEKHTHPDHSEGTAPVKASPTPSEQPSN